MSKAKVKTRQPPFSAGIAIGIPIPSECPVFAKSLLFGIEGADQKTISAVMAIRRRGNR